MHNMANHHIMMLVSEQMHPYRKGAFEGINLQAGDENRQFLLQSEEMQLKAENSVLERLNCRESEVCTIIYKRNSW